MRRISLLLAAALAVSGAPGAAQATHSGSISGTVRDEAAAGIADVCVEASGEGWYETATDAAGAYVLEGLEPGIYVVRFFDCAQPARYIAEYYDDAASYDEADPVAVVAGQQTAGIDATLALGGSITGTVTNEVSGEPAVEVCVQGVGQESWVGATTTQADGTYVLGGLPTGSVRVVFGSCWFAVPVPGKLDAPRSLASSPPVVEGESYVAEWYDDKPDYESADLVAVTAGEQTLGIDAALTPAASIAGVVTDGADRAIQGVCVEALDEEGSWGGGGYQWDEGGYRIDGLRPGSYRVYFVDCDGLRYRPEWYDDRPTFEEADLVHLGVGEDRLGVNAQLAPLPSPDLTVADLRVRSIPLRTDDLTLVSTGWSRTVDVDVANIGSDAGDAVLVVSVRGRSDRNWRVVARDYVALEPGASASRSFDWNGLGTVGDVKVRAELCAWLDADHGNNVKELDHYVIVGGTGIGVSGPARSGRMGICEPFLEEHAQPR